MLLATFQMIILLSTLLLSTQQTKPIEQCLRQALNPTTRDVLYLADFNDIKVALRDYALLPESLRSRIDVCFREHQSDVQNLCLSANNGKPCAPRGMSFVPDCEPGFARIDATVCARECPKHLEKLSLGALFKKPLVEKRKVYDSVEECKDDKNHKCEDFGKFATSACPDDFRPIGKFLCVYKCPDGFEDMDSYCVPETRVNNEYFITNLE